MDGATLKQEGMDRAANARSHSLSEAKEIVKQIALKRGSRCVCADDYFNYCIKNGVDPGSLGPAAGHLFGGGDWEFTGKRIVSKRPSNHGREIKVWRLK